jgi:23S rRNA (adenine2503-C2)-methyltransferase
MNPPASSFPPLYPLARFLPPEWLERFKNSQEQPLFRGKQILEWVYKKYISNPQEMTNLPKTLKEKLQLISSTVHQIHQSPDGTEKLLIQLFDKRAVECVLIRHEERRTGCISTQVGCPVACVFCASGLNGVTRNLEVEEIVEQVLHLMARNQGLDNLVVMGMGEPFLNYSNLLKALRIINHPDGFHLGARRITVSTSGVLAGIERLKQEPEQFHLAISLHSADETQRQELVPHLRVSVTDLLNAAEDFQKNTGRRVTLEYVLLQGINDSLAHAKLLRDRILHKKFLVNLIPMNPVPDLPYQAPSNSQTLAFQSILHQAGINTKLRLQKGDAISAACGQLLRSHPS